MLSFCSCIYMWLGWGVQCPPSTWMCGTLIHAVTVYNCSGITCPHTKDASLGQGNLLCKPTPEKRHWDELNSYRWSSKDRYIHVERAKYVFQGGRETVTSYASLCSWQRGREKSVENRIASRISSTFPCVKVMLPLCIEFVCDCVDQDSEIKLFLANVEIYK